MYKITKYSFTLNTIIPNLKTLQCATKYKIK